MGAATAADDPFGISVKGARPRIAGAFPRRRPETPDAVVRARTPDPATRGDLISSREAPDAGPPGRSLEQNA
jgi:hypothetical protein